MHNIFLVGRNIKSWQPSVWFTSMSFRNPQHVQARGRLCLREHLCRLYKIRMYYCSGSKSFAKSNHSELVWLNTFGTTPIPPQCLCMWTWCCKIQKLVWQKRWNLYLIKVRWLSFNYNTTTANCSVVGKSSYTDFGHQSSNGIVWFQCACKST